MQSFASFLFINCNRRVCLKQMRQEHQTKCNKKKSKENKYQALQQHRLHVDYLKVMRWKTGMVFSFETEEFS